MIVRLEGRIATKISKVSSAVDPEPGNYTINNDPVWPRANDKSRLHRHKIEPWEPSRADHVKSRSGDRVPVESLGSSPGLRFMLRVMRPEHLRFVAQTSVAVRIRRLITEALYKY